MFTLIISERHYETWVRKCLGKCPELKHCRKQEILSLKTICNLFSSTGKLDLSEGVTPPKKSDYWKHFLKLDNSKTR